MIWVTAGLVAAGTVFGGLNTLYAAFASRIRELATLQAIGYQRSSDRFNKYKGGPGGGPRSTAGARRLVAPRVSPADGISGVASTSPTPAEG